MPTNAFAAGAYAAIQTMGRTPASGVAGAGESGFTQLLSSALDGVAEAGKRADGQAMAAAAGKANVVDVVTAVAESETALQTLVAVRDRVISAYEDIMRMQI
ncbi:flagellar hook-basal body complex protein FliE [Methylobacterium platani]|uniref:Flagellar hook-basal body complex protein FliE n=2 Tax=Methylobacterium platani TaxID=427683 RepID=A0A179SJI3_9HYPH|nr:flagellar hook-basal body complex protein FliE [Methylobacterium platani]KMO15052.1 flagellar hook-basal body protein FliE [Methylobacterium platani JCM 14648]OAS27180.1 flagellar hook-basal body protein FliE [Methylobacterium platani]